MYVQAPNIEMISVVCALAAMVLCKCGIQLWRHGVGCDYDVFRDAGHGSGERNIPIAKKIYTRNFRLVLFRTVPWLSPCTRPRPRHSRAFLWSPQYGFFYQNLYALYKGHFKLCKTNKKLCKTPKKKHHRTQIEYTNHKMYWT